MAAGPQVQGEGFLGTMGGMLIARPIEQRLLQTSLEAFREFKTAYPDDSARLIWRWRDDADFRGWVDRRAIGGMAAVTALSNQMAPVFGPFRGIFGEAAEFFSRSLPEILPRVLGPEADRFTPPPGLEEPTRPQAEGALGRYVTVVAARFPRSIVSLVGQFNPSRWLTQAGEQAQQAVNACGPLAMIGFSEFYYVDLVTDEAKQILETKNPQEEFAYCWRFFNTPDEVINFLCIPTRTARLYYIKLLLSMRRLRLFLSPEDLKRIRQQIKDLNKNDIQPFLRATARDLRRTRRNWVVEHRPLFERRAHQPLGGLPMIIPYLLIGIILAIALLLNK